MQKKIVMEQEETNKSGMTVDAFYDYITKHLTPEEALKRLLMSSLHSYDKLRFEQGEEVHPLFIMSMAAMEMGWSISVLNTDPNAEVEGIACGTEVCMNRIFQPDRSKAQQELIELYKTQVVDLTMMSKIELGDDVIAEIKRLQDIISSQ